MELNLNQLKEIVIDAIQQFSEDYYSAGWLVDIEYIVLDLIKNNDPNLEIYFRGFQIDAMREMLYNGHWVKWNESNSEGKGNIQLYKIFDSVPIKQSAD